LIFCAYSIYRLENLFQEVVFTTVRLVKFVKAADRILYFVTYCFSINMTK